MADDNQGQFLDGSKALRRTVEAFALSEASDPWHRRVLTEFYANWHRWNGDYFDGALVTPLILIAEPSRPQRLGDYAEVSGFGGAGQIRIRPSLVRGTHPLWEKTPEKIDAMRFGLDVLLHESIHQWQYEVAHETEDSYSGHGPVFRDKCNEIGARMGLGRVRMCKKRGKDAELPSCSQWPHCVRPDGFHGELRARKSTTILVGRASAAIGRLIGRIDVNAKRDSSGDQAREALQAISETIHEALASNVPSTEDARRIIEETCRP